MDSAEERNAMVKRVFDIGLRLFAICAVSAVSLSIVNALTKPQIVSNRLMIEEETIAQIVTSGIVGEKKEPAEDEFESLYTVYTDGTKSAVAGYVIKISGSGYGGEIKVLAYYTPSGELVAGRLMENRETPGLGKKAEDSSYMNTFVGKGGSPDAPIPFTKQMLVAETGTRTSGERRAGTNNAFASFTGWMFGHDSGGGTDSVTGATITFVGVSAALRNGSEYVKSLGSGTADGGTQ